MQGTAIGLIYWEEQSGTKQIPLHPEWHNTRPLLTERGKVDFYGLYQGLLNKQTEVKVETAPEKTHMHSH